MKHSDPVTRLLTCSEWFAELPAEEMAAVRDTASTTSYRAGELVCERDSLAMHWLGVAEGVLKVESAASDGTTTAIAGMPAGAWFGEGAVLKGERRPYSVTAISDSLVAFIPREIFLSLMDDNPAFRRWLISQCWRRANFEPPGVPTQI